MNEELRDLYQEVILDHNRNPRNFRQVEHATHASEGYNPLCGDKIHLSLELEDGKIRDAGFQGSGCAISKASASVMTSAIKGKTVEEAWALFAQFSDMVTGDMNHHIEPEKLGKLAVFAGVREFPSRVKCAALAWHTMSAALKNGSATVSTE